jgi:hypothetical protein
VCADILRARGHELVTVDKTPKPDALCAMIGEFDGLIVRRCVVCDGGGGRLLGVPRVGPGPGR